MATVATLPEQIDTVTNHIVPEGPGSKLILCDSNLSNTQYLPNAIKGFRVDVAGAVKFSVKDESGAIIDITRNFVAGEVWDICPVYRVWSTGTTATGIDGVY